MILILAGILCFEPLPAALSRAAILEPENAANNPAILPRLSGWGLGVGYSRLYGLPELSAQRLNFFHSGQFPLTIELKSFGSEIYREYSFTLGSGYALSPQLSTGLGLKVMGVEIANYGSDGLFSIDLGVIYLWPPLNVGATISNLNRPHLESGDGLERQALISLGLQPAAGLRLAGELAWDGSQTSSLIEAELTPIQSIALRLGLAQNPMTLGIGLRLRYKTVKIDYGYQFHPRLGGSQGLGLGFAH